MKSAVILAAGEGARAWPFSGIRQKVTVPILNVPMVRRLALDLIALEIPEIVVVAGHRAEAVRHALGDLPGVRFVVQQPLRGPVDAALCGLAEVGGKDVLICCGDIVTTRENIKKVIQAAGSSQTAVLTAPCPDGLTASCTAVDVDAGGLVRGIWGDGDAKHPRFGGMVVGKTDTLRYYYSRDPGIMVSVGVGAMPPPEGNLAYALEMMRKEGIDIVAVMAEDVFVDVDKPWHILEANYLAGRHQLASMEATVISPGAIIDDGAEIAADARLFLGRDAHIGKGCHIGGSCVLGDGAQVINGAILEPNVFMGANGRCEDYAKVGSGSVMGENGIISHCAEFDGVSFNRVYLYHYSCVSGLIGCNVDIGAATVCGTWRFDDGTRVQEVQGRKEVPECHGSCTYIGDYCRTGVNVVFMPGVRIGSYSCVGGGAIVYEDIPERTLLLPKQEHVLKPWGPEKYGW